MFDAVLTCWMSVGVAEPGVPPTPAESKVAVPVQPTASPAYAPLSVHEVSVAAVVPSYVLLAALMLGYTVAMVMFAVVVAVVLESV